MEKYIRGVEIICKMDLKEITAHLEEISFAERVNIVNLLAFYARNNFNALNIINALLKADTSIDKTKCQIQTFNINRNRYEDKSVFIKFQKLFEDVRVLNSQQKYQSALLIYCIFEKTNITPEIINLKALSREMSLLAIFYKRISNKDLYVTIDTLDENVYLFNNNGNAYEGALQTFINSIVNSELLGLALGSEPAFHILIFLPKIIPEIKFAWTRIDKIPIIYLNWNYLLLNNYADFVLYNLNNNSKDECRKLPSFAGLMPNKYISEKVLKLMGLPRYLNIFMQQLINVMNDNCLKRTPPFVANEADVDEALILAKKARFRQSLNLYF